MKKKIIWVVILLISHTIFFIGGDIRGKHLTMNYVFKETKKVDTEVALGRYTIYRDIVADIKTGKNENALCRANLEASEYFDDIKSCLANQECRDSIAKKTREVAPESLDNTPLKFDYLKSENGIRRCDKAAQINVRPQPRPEADTARLAVVCHLIAKRRSLKRTAIKDMIVALIGPFAIPWLLIAKPENA